MSVALATDLVPENQQTDVGPMLTDAATHRQLQAHCQRAGVYFLPDAHEPWFLSTRHTVEDIDTVCSVIADGLMELS
jgi:glutamate-1-semialdehyde 2,1-aminomutase